MYAASILVVALAAYVGAQGTCFTPLKKSPDDCCPAMPMFVNEALVVECGFKEDPSNPQPPTCEQFQCMLRKGNLLGADNRIDRTNVIQSLKQIYSAEWHSIMESTVPKCLNIIDTKPSECEARQFSMCFLHDLLMNCPGHLWEASPECDAAKSFLQNCLPPPM